MKIIIQGSSDDGSIATLANTYFSDRFPRLFSAGIEAVALQGGIIPSQLTNAFNGRAWVEFDWQFNTPAEVPANLAFRIIKGDSSAEDVLDRQGMRYLVTSFISLLVPARKTFVIAFGDEEFGLVCTGDGSWPVSQ